MTFGMFLKTGAPVAADSNSASASLLTLPAKAFEYQPVTQSTRTDLKDHPCHACVLDHGIISHKQGQEQFGIHYKIESPIAQQLMEQMRTHPAADRDLDSMIVKLEFSVPNSSDKIRVAGWLRGIKNSDDQMILQAGNTTEPPFIEFSKAVQLTNIAGCKLEKIQVSASYKSPTVYSRTNAGMSDSISAKSGVALLEGYNVAKIARDSGAFQNKLSGYQMLAEKVAEHVEVGYQAKDCDVSYVAGRVESVKCESKSGEIESILIRRADGREFYLRPKYEAISSIQAARFETEIENSSHGNYFQQSVERDVPVQTGVNITYKVPRQEGETNRFDFSEDTATGRFYGFVKQKDSSGADLSYIVIDPAPDSMHVAARDFLLIPVSAICKLSTPDFGSAVQAAHFVAPQTTSAQGFHVGGRFSTRISAGGSSGRYMPEPTRYGKVLQFEPNLAELE